MTLYLKYRPQTIDEIDITSVRVTLTNMLKSGSIPHAFLFAGPKGTGKTSLARILAKAINCEERDSPCNKCEQCKSITNGTNIDVIEMDAASNRGIDDVRALRDVVKLAPANSKAKIYILDEVHMLTTDASNALLKTLEEPPAHVYFILATTNPEKLIETIKSRVTVIPFNKATPEEILRSLKRVVIGEKIKIQDDDLAKIAKLAKGSFRDAVKNLEQYTNDESFFNSTTSFDVHGFLEILITKNIKNILEEISKAVSNGTNSSIITELILDELRLELLAMSGIGDNKYSFHKLELICLIELLIESFENAKISPIDELPLELALIKWIGEDSKIEPEKEKKQITDESLKKKLSNLDSDYWDKILSEVKPINASIEGLLRAATPLGMDGDNLKLGVYYKFHKDKLEELKTKKMLEDVTFKIFDKTIRIECCLTELPQNTPLTEVKNENIMNVVEEIFT